MVHLSITMAVFMQLIIFPVFWTVLAPISYRRQKHDWPHLAYTFYSHIIPAFGAFGNLVATDAILTYQHLVFLICSGIMYLGWNWHGVTH